MTQAFNADTINQLYNNIRTLFNRRQAIAAMPLTHEEYLNVFVPANLRDAFRAVAGTIDNKTFRNWKWLSSPNAHASGPVLGDEMLACSIKFNALAPPVPRVLEVQPDADPEILERIGAWIERGGDCSREFGRVNLVLASLNKEFSRVAIRYYWPTIIALCNADRSTLSLGKELQELRMPAKLKPLPRGLLTACRQTSETVAIAQLLPEKVEDQAEKSDISISIQTGQYYREPCGTFYGMG
jgi:hypothetical protein